MHNEAMFLYLDLKQFQPINYNFALFQRTLTSVIQFTLPVKSYLRQEINH